MTIEELKTKATENAKKQIKGAEGTLLTAYTEAVSNEGVYAENMFYTVELPSLEALLAGAYMRGAYDATGTEKTND